jgi:hypothetical protein
MLSPQRDVGVDSRGIFGGEALLFINHTRCVVQALGEAYLFKMRLMGFTASGKRSAVNGSLNIQAH